jgi:ABC-type polysaccharide/polyol phosphate transport system ATPase subunit
VAAGVLVPTSGRRAVHGAVVPVLELGAGFDFELTGKESGYLNALLMGYTRREIDEKLDETIDFADLDRFIE